MELELPYGQGKTRISVPGRNLAGVLTPNAALPGPAGQDEVRRALDEPIGSLRLEDIARPGERVAIVTSDITRPMPTKAVLPAVLERLYRAGAKDEDITVVFALGNHRKHTGEERRHLAGDDVFERIRCLDSDQSRAVHLGTTSLGTPVEIFEEVARADRVICLGNIEYHYFAGYSGGVKAVMPGVSTAAAIQQNHKRMVEPTSTAGRIEQNRVRSDIDEAVKFVPIDFLLNVVLDEKKEVLRAFAGHPILAHREGCAFLDRIYKVKIKRRADIVVVSPGGYPKDINLYQAQKALDNAKHAVKRGGVIILCAACGEGLGEEVFERWMLEAECPGDLIERVGRKFELGGHKAAAIGVVMQRADVYLVSDMEAGFVEKLFFKPFDSAQRALGAALFRLGEEAKVLVMPYGGATLPDAGSEEA